MASLAELKFRIKLNLTKIEFYENYKKDINTSIDNINSYLSEMRISLDYLSDYLRINKFPTDYPKWCMLITTNPKEINDSSSKYLIDSSTILKFRTENLRGKNEIETNCNEVINWCGLWEGAKKTFQKELDSVSEIITTLRVEVIQCKKALLDLDLPTKLKIPKDKIELALINKDAEIETDSFEANDKKNLKKIEWGDQKQIILAVLEKLNCKKGNPFTKKLTLQVQEEIKMTQKMEIAVGNIKKVARDAGYKKPKY